MVIMKCFFDCEFTGVHQNTTLISLGFVAETGQTFYAECGDFDHSQIDGWLQKNVITNLKFYGKEEKKWCSSETQKAGTNKAETTVYGNIDFVAECLEEWIVAFGQIEMWSDCLSYNWVLLNQLWRNTFNFHANVYYIPFDISTLFKIKEIDTDINREEFSGLKDVAEKHNSLWNAKVIKACYEKLNENNKESKSTEIEKLKKALKSAILNTNRACSKLVDYDSAGSTYEIDWLNRVKEWAKLCDLDLEKHDPFYFQETHTIIVDKIKRCKL